ncbi:PHD finger protein 21A-like isoform X2 [Dreissena polymorpha]|uniref:PHD finger protein 21A-like isoform X2 n=1 Tax=Dreissena polymorpha TaxID=45954 RepID=UPI0022656C9C|nr:PHD finger protein 21A-like isoform X2 [Dreissena polymorpha]
MSKAELNKTQSDLKIAIQTHQILVSKMQVHELDLGLTSQLHSLQKEILSLNQKQKQIVQKLKLELIERTTGMGVENSDPQVCVSTSTPDPGSYVTQASLVMWVPPLTPTPTVSPTTLRIPSYQAGMHNRLEPKDICSGHNVLGSMSSNQSRGGSDPKHSRQRASAHAKQTSSPDVYIERARELKQKLDFMACIELVPPDSVSDAVGKRSERKRRSTNNPNFAYGIELERRSKLSNFIASDYFGAKKNKGVLPKQRYDSSSSDTPPSSPVPSPSNSQLKHLPKDQEEKCCADCGEAGELTACEGCARAYHEDCISAPEARLTDPSAPEARLTDLSRRCKQCQEVSLKTSQSLTAVSEYIEARRGKEEEKRRLLKRNMELLQEKMLLENRTQQLNDILARHGIKKQELLDINLGAKQSVENLKHFVKSVQSS